MRKKTKKRLIIIIVLLLVLSSVILLWQMKFIPFQIQPTCEELLNIPEAAWFFDYCLYNASSEWVCFQPDYVGWCAATESQCVNFPIACRTDLLIGTTVPIEPPWWETTSTTTTTIPQELNLNIPYTNNPPIIDDVISVGEWDDALEVEIVNEICTVIGYYTGPDYPSGQKTAFNKMGHFKFKFIHDGEKLYMQTWVKNLPEWNEIGPAPYWYKDYTNGWDEPGVAWPEKPSQGGLTGLMSCNSREVFNREDWIFFIDGQEVVQSGGQQMTKVWDTWTDEYVFSGMPSELTFYWFHNDGERDQYGITFTEEHIFFPASSCTITGRAADNPLIVNGESFWGEIRIVDWNPFRLSYESEFTMTTIPIECISPIDCEGKIHPLCTGYWVCIDNKCNWLCDTITTTPYFVTTVSKVTTVPGITTTTPTTTIRILTTVPMLPPTEETDLTIPILIGGIITTIIVIGSIIYSGVLK